MIVVTRVEGAIAYGPDQDDPDWERMSLGIRKHRLEKIDAELRRQAEKDGKVTGVVLPDAEWATETRIE